jgi:hypothetical protein
MIKKERIFELKIEEDDELSGIDSISLVSEPAIEINWLAFNRECQDGCGLSHDFSSDDHRYVEHIMTNAETEEDLFNDGWVVDSFEIVTGKENFVSTEPNAPSIEDEEEYKVRYKYVLNPLIDGPAIISTSRAFCRELIAQNKVFRIEDIENATNDYGQSPLVYRNSWNCRHVWQRIKYRKDADIINKASVNKGKVTIAGFPNDLADPDYRVLGYDQANTATNKTKGNPSPRTERTLGGMLTQGATLSLSKDKFQEECPEATQNVAVNLENRQRAINEAHYGPLNPNEPNEEYWKAKAKMFNGDVESAKKARCGNCAFFVKTPSMLECIAGGINDVNELDTIQAADLGYCEAFDFKCAAARTCDAWVVGGPIVEENLGYDVSALPAYKDELPTGKTESFESYTDYPEGAKNNAKRALDWAEKNGWGSCGTPVGKARANQLAKGEAISEETIARMASFARHAQNKDVPYSEGCGGLMWDAWGGTSGIEWAQNKLERIRKEKMSKQKFAATDEEKRIVIGPAMVPHQKIIRKDKITGEPYYVFFSPDTIKMIADKYMKNQYTRNNDTEHDGKAVNDIYVTESWIVEDERYDKSKKYGFEVPVGSWMVAMKIPKTPKGEEVWQKIKAGELNGFSVSGYFEEVAKFSREEMFLFKLEQILKETGNN